MASDPQIGSTTFALRLATGGGPCREWLPGLATATRRVTREGIDGEAAKQLGTRGQPVQWRFVKFFATWSAALTHAETVAALQGTIAEVRHEEYSGGDESTYADCLVEMVGPPQTTPCIYYDGATTYTVRVAHDITLVQITAQDG